MLKLTKITIWVSPGDTLRRYRSTWDIASGSLGGIMPRITVRQFLGNCRDKVGPSIVLVGTP